jgi:hypothetical protein
MKTLFQVLVLSLALMIVAGCDRAGPAEKAGRNIDEAGRAASQSIEKAGENIRDAVKDKK